ncbi:MAG: OsmC family protein [Anaerolineales bacterium]
METTSKSVKLEWVGSRMFAGTDSKGHSLTIGYNRDHRPESQGASPSDLLMLSAASCSAYDVVEILEKQKQPLEGLSVTVTGTQKKDPPTKYLSMHLTYRVKGDVEPEKLERAIQLSEEKYCTVSITLRQCVDITSEYKIHP